MSYENPRQPEGINVTDDHPLREFFSLLLVLIIIVVSAVTLLTLAAQRLAFYIPFETEMRIANTLGIPDSIIDTLSDTDASVNPEDRRAEDRSVQEMQEMHEMREVYLQELAERLAGHMNIPEDVTFTVHYSPSETVNAYATLGGHVIIFEGLLDALANENAVAMVLAHELSHVKLRHPIVATSRGLTVAIALSSIVGFSDNGVAGSLVQWLGSTTVLSFNRDQERAADLLAMNALIAEYGHLEGAVDLFKALADETENLELPSLFTEFNASHPALRKRITAIGLRSDELGATGTVRPLPW